MIEAQGGNPAVVDDPGALPQARHSEVWAAPRDGLVSEVVPRDIGRAINAMGGGRQRVSDHIDHVRRLSHHGEAGARGAAGPAARHHSRAR